MRKRAYELVVVTGVIGTVSSTSGTEMGPEQFRPDAPEFVLQAQEQRQVVGTSSGGLMSSLGSCQKRKGATNSGDPWAG